VCRNQKVSGMFESQDLLGNHIHIKSYEVQQKDHKENTSRRNFELFMNSQFSQKMNVFVFHILYLPSYYLFAVNIFKVYEVL
jgi:hypothetical protein